MAAGKKHFNLVVDADTNKTGQCQELAAAKRKELTDHLNGVSIGMTTDLWIEDHHKLGYKVITSLFVSHLI